MPLLIGWSGADIPGSRNDIVGTWLARNSWENLRDVNWLVNNPDYMTFLNAYPNRAADIGVPLIPHDMSWDLNALLDECISGARDSIYRSMGAGLATNGPQTVKARVYWEMNMSPDPANRLDRNKFKAAWARAVPLIREGFASVARTGQRLQIVWCPLSDGAPKMEFWPGGEYVDIVAVDAYASKWSAYTPSAAELTSWVGAQLKEIADIGRAQSKPVGMGEWSNWSSKPNEQGTAGSKGRDDFPAYIDQVFDWAMDPYNNVDYLCYYNISALGTDQVITDTPNSLARYQARSTAIQSGTETGGTAPTTPTSPTPTTVDTSAYAFMGTWGEYDGERFSNVASNYARVGVTIGTGGGTITYRGEKSPNNGIVAVSIDGGTETLIDLYNEGGFTGPLNLWTSPTLSAGQHIVRVRVTGNTNAAAVVNAEGQKGYVSVYGASTTNGQFITPSSLPASDAPTPTTPPTQTILPPAQGSITATPFSSSRIDLAWGSVTGATGYDIERDGVIIATAVTGTSYSDTGLATQSSHTYRIRTVG